MQKTVKQNGTLRGMENKRKKFLKTKATKQHQYQQQKFQQITF